MLAADLVPHAGQAALPEQSQGSGLRIHARAERSGAELIIAIRDEAPPFDPTHHPTPDLDEPLATRRPGGFGIHLTRICVDRVTPRERLPQGNELRLVRHLEPPNKESRA